MSHAAGAPSRKLRILALHGYTSNAFVLQRRLGAIRKTCRDVADFVVVNGPIRVEPITSSVQSLDAPEQRASSSADDTPLEEQPRAWWRSNDDGSYQQFDESIDLLNQELATTADQGPFDGVFGFSQGACFAALLASAFEDPSRYPRLRLPAGQGPLRFCVAVSGFRARDPTLQSLYPEGGIKTPILHVLGRADQIVDEDRAKTLNDVAKHLRVEEHDGGHVIPSQAPWRNFYHDLFVAFQDPAADQEAGEGTWLDVIGPSERPKGEHTANSGTATPTGTKSNDKSSL